MNKPNVEDASTALATVGINMVTQLRIITDALPMIVFDAAGGDGSERNDEVVAWLSGFMLRMEPVLKQAHEQIEGLIELAREHGFWDENADDTYLMETDVLRDLHNLETTDEPPLD